MLSELRSALLQLSHICGLLTEDHPAVGGSAAHLPPTQPQGQDAGRSLYVHAPLCCGSHCVAAHDDNQRRSIKSWRNRSQPSLPSIEACLNALGWDLTPVPAIEILPNKIAADLGRLAAKMQIGSLSD
jgi:hypothetical protein